MNPPEYTQNPPAPPFHQPQGDPKLSDDAGFGALIDSLLKRPMQLIDMLCNSEKSRHWLRLFLVTLFTFVLYGLVVGSFHGDMQYAISPLKIAAGETLAILICFPSLYIFTCLSGMEISLRALAGVFMAMSALTGLLLLGFAPVGWVFSQSTNSPNFIAVLHLAFWWISTLFGIRMFSHMMLLQRLPDRIHLKVWTVIFILVSLQMTAALRPIISPSSDLLPREKKFFLTYWYENSVPGTLQIHTH